MLMVVLVFVSMITLPFLVMIVLIMHARWQTMRNPEMHGRPVDKPITTMAVLGTGGHTTEMTLLLRHLDRNHYRPLVYVYTNDFCRETVTKIEESHGNVSNCIFLWISRSRHVGQAWLSSMLTFAQSIPRAVRHVVDYKPTVLLVNGPGVCIPVCLGAILLNVIWGHRCAIVFVESICRVRRLSFSGKILYYVATAFCIQWPIPDCPDAVCLSEDADMTQSTSSSQDHLDTAERSSGSLHCLVTVGTTNFDSLMRALDASAADFLESLRELGISSATIQVGATSTFWPENLAKLPNFRVVTTLKHAEFLTEVEKADLIVGHAGAGTIVEALSNGKQLVVVPNRSLMDDHQLELCEAIAGKFTLSCSECDVVATLKGARAAFQSVSCRLPSHLCTNDFAVRLDDMMRLEGHKED